MKKKLLYLVMALALIICTSIPSSTGTINILAESNEGQIKEYKLNDQKIPELDPNLEIDYLTTEISDKSLSTYDESNISIITYDVGDPNVPIVDTDNINFLSDMLTRGKYIPTQFYDLGYSDYAYGISNLRYLTHSNYYFNTNPNGCISVSINGLDGPIVINIYEQGTDKFLSSWTGDPTIYSGVGFTGLTKSKLYYFRFSPKNYGVPLSGTGLIFHDN